MVHTKTYRVLTHAASSQMPFFYMAMLLMVAWIAAMSLWSTMLPASWWLVVRDVHVYDTVVGTPPRMSVDRTVKRPFYGRWVVTVQRSNEDGSFSVHCTATGAQSYDKTAKVPTNLNLNWWTWPRECQLPVGVYRVLTTWYLEPSGHSDVETSFTSNAFRVLP